MSFAPSTGKSYDSANGPAYAFTPAGRLRTRAWARGVSALYGYDARGDLRFVTYSNSAGLNLTNTFDRRGRLQLVQQGTNLTALAWHDAGALASESRNGVVLTNAYDALLRRASVAVQGQPV